MVETEQDALKKASRGKKRLRGLRRFTRATSPVNLFAVAGNRASSHSDDLAKWKVMIEEPLQVNHKGIDVYKLQQWT